MLMKIKVPFWPFLMCLFLKVALVTPGMLRGEISQDKVVLSGGAETGAWSYRFIKLDPSSNPSIESSSRGNVYFEDEDWVVAARDSIAYGAKRKTEITFFNAKTLETIAIASVPNILKHVGKLPGGDCFYFVTKTSGKYDFDDAPLVLILVKPLSSEMERIMLSEGDHWLAHSATSVITSRSDILIKVESEKLKDYHQDQFKDEAFSKIKCKIVAGAVYSSDSGNPIVREVGSSLNRKSLVYLKNSCKYLNEENSLKEERGTVNVFGNVTDVSTGRNGVSMVRSTGFSKIQTINFMRLQSDDLKIPDKEVSEIGFFDSGTVRMLASGSIMFFPADHSVGFKRVPVPMPSRVSFDGKFAYYSKYPGKDEESSSFFGVNSKEWTVVSQDGAVVKKILTPEIASKIKLKYDDFTVFPDQNFLVVNRRPQISKARDGSVEWNATSGEGGPNRFSVISLRDGSELIKPIETESYCYGSSLNANFDALFNDWKVASVISGFDPKNGNKLFEVYLQGPEKLDSYKLAGDLSKLPDVLKCRTLKGDLVDVVFSHAGVTNYIRFSTVSKQTVFEKQWQSPSGSGVAQFVDGANLLFIPKTFGYSVYSVFGETGPSYVFDLHLDASEGYAIVLPNGCFAGSPGCESLLKLKAKGGLVPAPALLPWRNRPAEVIKALGGAPQDVELLTKVTERWFKKLNFDPASPEPSANEVPKIAVEELPRLWADWPTVTFAVKVTSSFAALREVTLRVNGVLQKSFGGPELESGEPGTVRLSGTVSLAGRQNWIEVSAKDVMGRPSNVVRFRSILTNAKEPTKRFVIALGVSKYQDSSLNLAFAAKDAKDVSEVLKAASPSGAEVLILTDEKVTKEALGQIRSFLSGATENDEVIAFCAGHGMLDKNLDYFFVGHDFEQARPGETGIKLDDLVDVIGSSRSLNRLLLLDTCHSGQVGERDELLLAQIESSLPKGVRAVRQRGMSAKSSEGLNSGGQQRFIEEMFLLPGLHRGINIIGASGGAEFALESAEWNNGVFTSSIIEALRDKKADENFDGRITVAELRAYLAKRVPELTGGAQKPSVVANERDQDFDLVKASLRLSSVDRKAAVPVPPSASATALSAEEVFRAYYRSVQDRDEKGAASFLAAQVDYEQAGKISKSRVLADLKGDWKRYQDSKFYISDFEKTGTNSYRFILDYQLLQGVKPRRGKLEMTAILSGPEGAQISALRAKVISAK